MKLRIDSHILLWAAIDDPRLRGNARDAFADPENLLMISVATMWEIGIKHAMGRLPLPVPARDFFACEIATRGYSVLDVERAHAERAAPTGNPSSPKPPHRPRPASAAPIRPRRSSMARSERSGQGFLGSF